MSNKKSYIEGLLIHGKLGETIPYHSFLDWVKINKRGIEQLYLSWLVDGEQKKLTTGKSLMASPLPDNSGLICFDEGFIKDGCYVIDAYGQFQYRLTVPWELTNRDVPKDAKMWFRNVGKHVDGQFGVIAWIEYAGDYYFELDYHTGKFLWGKEIRF
jgi:hypothetical protein